MPLKKVEAERLPECKDKIVHMINSKSNTTTVVHIVDVFHDGNHVLAKYNMRDIAISTKSEPDVYFLMDIADPVENKPKEIASEAGHDETEQNLLDTLYSHKPDGEETETGDSNY